MVYDYFDKYTFLCEMYDEHSDEIIMLTLNFFPFDNSIQVVNSTKGKTLLRRVHLPTLRLEALQIGNIVNVFSKLLLIRDFSPATKRTLYSKSERTFAMIKPQPPKWHGRIITFILQKGFRIVQGKSAKINKDFAIDMYSQLSGNSSLPLVVDYVTSGEVIGLELEAPNAVSKWRACLGATDPKDADPDTLRGLYGENMLRNAAHGVNTVEDAKRTIEWFFGFEKGIPKIPYLASCKNCTCCIIKPHAAREHFGEILECINLSGKFVITAMALFDLNIKNTKEFYEIYKGVLVEYEAMSIELATGTCVVLEVKSTESNKNPVCGFRKLCGPRDPDLCRQLYPNSIRALFGKTITQNGVHCTDLPEDGVSEVYDYFDKYTFICEMYDEHIDEIIILTLNFFPFDNSIQVVNSTKGKILLRRVHLPTLRLEALQIGNIVNVFSKLLLIRDFSPVTKRTLFNKSERTFVLIKPQPPKWHGRIITFILQHGFRIVQGKNAKINKDFAIDMYSQLSGNSSLPLVIDYVTSGEVIGLELEAPNAVSKWRACLGGTDPKDAEPGTLRGLYGESMLRNAAHGVNTVEDAKKMIEWFFGYEKGIPKIPYLASCKDCTCCVIKPHAAREHFGEILECINSSGKFVITAMALFDLNIKNTKEFYEIYKGVLVEYEAMSIELATGTCVVLEVKSTESNKNPVCGFRKLCGPRDPDLCRQLYPNSIRALYGKTIIQNAVHCTDLPEDGGLEVEYFYKLVVSEFV